MPPPSSSSHAPSYSANNPPSNPGSSIMGSEDDQRFAELLRPIKDLTQNWEVPLSRYLEDYIEELSEVRINLGGGGVNFAEAALLLQGTVSVYSKKVDFLWQNVLKMLELLASRKALEEATGGPGGGGAGGPAAKRRRKGQHDVNDFVLISAEVSGSTNLKTDVAASEKVKDRKMTLNFISVTPRQLIEREGQEHARVRVNVYALGSRDLIGHKEDFRVNSQYLRSTAMIGEELSTERELEDQSVSLCEEDEAAFMETSLLHPMASPPPQANLEPIQEQEEDEIASVHPDLAAADDDFFDDAGEMPQLLGGGDAQPDATTTTTVQQHATVPDIFDAMRDSQDHAHRTDADDPMGEDGKRNPRKRRDKFQENLDEPKAPLTDKWEPVKPHEAAKVAAKPVKKGRSCKAPPNVDLKKNKEASTRRRNKKAAAGAEAEATDGGSKVVRVITPVEQYLIHEVVTHKYSNLAGRNHEVGSEFVEDAHQEAKERKDKNKDAQGTNNDQDAAAEVPSQDGGDADANNDQDGWEEFQGGVDNDDFGDALPDPHANDVQLFGAMLPSSGEGTSKDTAEASTSDTYEDLVMKRVAEFVQQSQEYIESTDLAKKVADWHEHIRPRLVSVEQRSKFDIREYGTDIIGHFPGETAANDAAEGGSSSSSSRKNRKTTLQFTELVAGKDREEICRYFLSSLMLANTYNIDLTSSEDTENSEIASCPSMDNIEMTLLSSKIHLIDLDHEAESDPAEDRRPVAAAASRGGKGGKNKSKKKPAAPQSPRKRKKAGSGPTAAAAATKNGDLPDS